MEVNIVGEIPTQIPLPTIPSEIYPGYDYGYAVGLGIWAIIIIVVISIGAAVGLAFIPATIARKKGYSYGGFWAFGFFLFIPALIVALVIEDKTQPRYQRPYPPYPPGPYEPPYTQAAASCPSCGAPITGNDAFCPSCGTRVK